LTSTIDNLTLEEFEEHRNSVKTTESEKPKTMMARCAVIDTEITRKTYDFDRQNNLLRELDRITVEETQKYFHHWIKPDSVHRKKLSVHVISTAKGGAGAEGSTAEIVSLGENQELISDYVAWKSTMGYFPAPRPCGNIPPWKTRTAC